MSFGDYNIPRHAVHRAPNVRIGYVNPIHLPEGLAEAVFSEDIRDTHSKLRAMGVFDINKTCGQFYKLIEPYQKAMIDQMRDSMSDYSRRRSKKVDLTGNSPGEGQTTVVNEFDVAQMKKRQSARRRKAMNSSSEIDGDNSQREVEIEMMKMAYAKLCVKDPGNPKCAELRARLHAMGEILGDENSDEDDSDDSSPWDNEVIPFSSSAPTRRSLTGAPLRSAPAPIGVDGGYSGIRRSRRKAQASVGTSMKGSTTTADQIIRDIEKEEKEDAAAPNDSGKKAKRRVLTKAEKKRIKDMDDRWNPRYKPANNELASDHQWFLCIWARVAFANVMLTLCRRPRRVTKYIEDKKRRWLDNHVPMILSLQTRYARGLSDSDICGLDLMENYTPMGPSFYPDDVFLIEEWSWNMRTAKPMPQDVLGDYITFSFTLQDEAERLLSISVGDNTEAINSVLSVVGPDERPLEDRTDPKHWLYPISITTAEQLARHTFYAACIIRMDMCQALCSDPDIPEDVKHKAYLYQLAFLDLFDYCQRVGRYDDVFLLTMDADSSLTPMEAFYPYPERSFHEGDLPNMFFVLNRDIVLSGERKDASHPVAKLMFKCLPFACQRRAIMRSIFQTCKEYDSYWKFFSKMMWCMLTGVYHGSTHRLDGPKAMRVRRICQNKEHMFECLAARGKLVSCTIVYTACRLYMGKLVEKCSHYLEATSKYFDWDEMIKDSHEMAAKVRDTNLHQEDAFSEARVVLERHNKNSKATSYRYRQYRLSHKLEEFLTTCVINYGYEELEFSRLYLSKFLEVMRLIESGEPYTEILQSLSKTDALDHLRDLSWSEPSLVYERCIEVCDILRRRIALYKVEVSDTTKENIFNLFLRIPPDEWYSSKAISVLRLDEYGGLTDQQCIAMLRLIEVNRRCGLPKESKEAVGCLTPYSTKVLAWTMHCIQMLDRIHLVPLDQATITRIDKAMSRKYKCIPGVLELCDSMYEVGITICCENIVSEMGRSCGMDNVHYDFNTQQLVCKRSKTERSVSHLDSSIAKDTKEVKERARLRKQALFSLPCAGQPILRLNLRGFMLEYNNDRCSKQRYMHCPKCAALHRFSLDGFVGQHDYVCSECIAEDDSIGQIFACAFCGANVKPFWMKRQRKTGMWIPPLSTVETIRLTDRDPGYSHSGSSIRVANRNTDDEPIVIPDEEEAPVDGYCLLADPSSCFQTLYLCDQHRKSAGKISYSRFDKQDLWGYIRKYTVSRKIKDASRYRSR